MTVLIIIIATNTMFTLSQQICESSCWEKESNQDLSDLFYLFFSFTSRQAVCVEDVFLQRVNFAAPLTSINDEIKNT